jgi:hypothetical protein
MNKLAPIMTVQNLKKYINNIRDLRKGTIKSDDLNEEQLYYLQEGYREGLCAAAMLLADELDAEIGEGHYLELEEQWWHYHNDEEGDIGTDERLIL